MYIFVLTGIVATFLMIALPTPKVLPPGRAPSDVPQPGSIGGGGEFNVSNSRSNDESTAIALTLVPNSNLSAVSVFPPFEPQARTMPAIGVIFSERLVDPNARPNRGKRDVSSDFPYHYENYHYQQPIDYYYESEPHDQFHEKNYAQPQSESFVSYFEEEEPSFFQRIKNSLGQCKYLFKQILANYV